MASSSHKANTVEKKTAEVVGKNEPEPKRAKVAAAASRTESRRGRRRRTRADTRNAAAKKAAGKIIGVRSAYHRKQLKGESAARKKRPYRAAAAARGGGGRRGSSQNRADDPSPVALLDMLAEVASATLQSDPTIHTRLKRVTRAGCKTRSSVAKRNAAVIAAARMTKSTVGRRSTSGGVGAAGGGGTSQQELLSLDQIRMLSDKLLLSMFAELTADEIRRNYSYSCYLVPEKCQQKYTSFGSENRARMQMKTHLLGHIAELLAETNTASGRPSQKVKFMAEPVSARRKRLAVDVEGGRKRQRRLPTPKTGQSAKVAKDKLMVVKTESLKKINQDNVATKASLGTTTPKAVAKEVKTSVARKAIKVELNATATICYDQPQHDHSYTTADGGKKLPDHYDEDEECSDAGGGGAGAESAEEEEEEEEEEEDEEDAGEFIGPDLNKGLYVVAQIEGLNLGGEPSTTTTSFRTKQAEMALRQLEAIRMMQMQKSRKVVVQEQDPPMMETVAAIQKLEESVAEELNAEDSDVEQNAPERGSPEWERKLALKCIRMLRTKKKDEHVPLVCRICKGGKSFTAQATLMYHYRSHAGIKPFMCSICNTTFTRQHSLNYHMLIHNNKSRFTCSDCGRKFRHPSHFKEHLRRHTGETPFECGDCGVRFKTRNTYKRHLKTRHGKLLTVNGILTLSTEEFLKVKTNPKKKQQQGTAAAGRAKKDKDTQWPEAVAAGDLKAIAISNVPFLPDIDAGDSFAAIADDEAKAAAEGTDNEYAEAAEALCQKTEDEEDDCFPGAAAYPSLHLETGQHASIIVLEALPGTDPFAQGETVAIALQPILHCT